jgi:hypothetical protein
VIEESAFYGTEENDGEDGNDNPGRKPPGRNTTFSQYSVFLTGKASAFGLTEEATFQIMRIFTTALRRYCNRGANNMALLVASISQVMNKTLDEVRLIVDPRLDIAKIRKADSRVQMIITEFRRNRADSTSVPELLIGRFTTYLNMINQLGKNHPSIITPENIIRGIIMIYLLYLKSFSSSATESTHASGAAFLAYRAFVDVTETASAFKSRLEGVRSGVSIGNYVKAMGVLNALPPSTSRIVNPIHELKKAVVRGVGVNQECVEKAILFYKSRFTVYASTTRQLQELVLAQQPLLPDFTEEGQFEELLTIGKR